MTTVSGRPCSYRHADPSATAAECTQCRLYLTDERYNRKWGGTGVDFAYKVVARGVTVGRRSGGPGTELKILLTSLGITHTTGCGCEDFARQMDEWGVTECRRNHAIIVDKLRENGAKLGFLDRLRAAARVVASALEGKSGLMFRLDPFDPLPGLVDEAIRRAEAKVEGGGVAVADGWTRHLVYYVYPVVGNAVWQCNLDQLLERVALFNGRRVCAVARQEGVVHHRAEHRGQRPSHTVDPPERVKERLASHGFDVIELENDGQLGEVAAFVPLLEQVAPYTGERDVTFYFHAKGVTRPVNPGVSVHPWTSLLYGANLDHWPAVRELLTRHPIAGAFKVNGKPWCYPGRFHYSGTAFWFRNRDVFGRPNWRDVPRIWGGVEAWPGVVFDLSEAGCVFWEEPIRPRVTGYHFPRLRQVMRQYSDWAKAQASAGGYTVDPKPWLKHHGYE